MNQLHILNGDTSFEQFNRTQIEGEVFIWKEILCEGETRTDLTSDNFWRIRQQFLKSYVDQFKDAEWNDFKARFQNIVLPKYREIILWFEYDLFCQINLIGLLSWIYNNLSNSDTNVSLICVGEHNNYQRLVGLGEITVEEFEAVYEKRKQLSQLDLVYGDKIWKIYCSGEHESLLEQIRTYKSENFEYLVTCITKHQKRFPSTKNGLNEIESKIVNLISEESKSKNRIIVELLSTQEIYGFGDLQYFKYVEKLAPIIEEKKGKLFLNRLGKQLIKNEIDFNELRETGDHYGGAKLIDLRWNESEKKLERKTGP